MTDTSLTVSVVVPHHGAPGPTLALVAGLLATTGPALQIIVSDDASPVPFPDTEGVEVVRRSSNGGFGAAVNSGAEAATGDLLLILNSDLEIAPGFIADLVAAAAPWQPAVVGPLLLDPDGTPANSARHFPTVAHQSTEWLTPLARFRSLAIVREAVGHDTRALPGVVVPVDWLVGAALLIPRDVFAAAGGFDGGYFMNSEEVDLQRRLRARGIPSVFVGTVSVTHEGGGSSDPDLRRRWLVDSRFRYAARWGGERRLRAALTGATAVNLAANATRRLIGNNDVHPWRTATQEWSLIWTGGEHDAGTKPR